MITLNSINKNYGDFHAVKNITLKVEPGEVMGFLGPNGAGKTTTIRMLMGILVPTSGEILINNLDRYKHRVEANGMLGYLPDVPIFYDYLTGSEILRFVGEMHGLDRKKSRERTEYLIERFGLIDAAADYAINYSLGMKKKLALACALIHEPRILILDEPTNGLDPRASMEVQKQLLDFTAKGGTIFLSTHLLNMAEKICNRVSVIHQGEIVALGEISEIRSRLQMHGSLEEIFLQVTATESESGN